MNGKNIHLPGPVVAFRVDASTEIGTGHVMRCLTLADALSYLSARCRFICRPHGGHLIGEIQDRGYEVVALPDVSNGPNTEDTGVAHAHWLGTSAARDAQDMIEALEASLPDWLIVDHYGIDANWEAVLRNACCQMMVIDDLADRPHDCDLLLDHGLEHGEADYATLTPVGTRLLCGPEYALLRPEFAELRHTSLARRQHPTLRNIFVSMGGVDRENVTNLILAALADSSLPDNVALTVVMGKQAPWLDEVRNLAATMSRPVRVLAGTTQMARLMHDADLAIGAAGTTSWERSCLGLPSVVLVLAANQTGVAATLQDVGAALAVRDPSDFSEFLSQHLDTLVLPETLAEMSRNASRITEGHGGRKVAACLVTWENKTALRQARKRYHPEPI